jgi:CheY-like chemotaxis protein
LTDTRAGGRHDACVAVLLVEDFEPFRRVLETLVHQRPDLLIIGEVSDGIDAVQWAKTLQPDLILLDLGLPRLHGIAAAQQIRQLAPHTILLVVSENASADVIRGAFRAGARGYVHKPRILRDLLPAIDAVLRGAYFVSRGIEDRESPSGLRRHDVQFYSDDRVFFDRATQFLAPALDAGHAAIVLATPSHRDGLVQRLKVEGADVDTAMHRGIYCSLDAGDALSSIMIHGVPDHRLFRQSLRDLIDSVVRTMTVERPRVVILGECVGLLCAKGDTEAAIGLEQTGNELLVIYDIDILCAYPSKCCPAHDRAYRRICAEHGAADVR